MSRYKNIAEVFIFVFIKSQFDRDLVFDSKNINQKTLKFNCVIL